MQSRALKSEKSLKRYCLAGLIICFGLLVPFTSCDAPRNNPLDPANPKGTFALLEGKVQSLSIPHKALENVLIRFEGLVIGNTNANGDYSIENFPVTSGWFYFEKTGYKTDSVFIDLTGSRRNYTEIFLNQIPVLDSFIVYSSVVNRYSLPSLYFINVVSKISDKDNDIDSVFLYNEETNYRVRLDYDVNTRAFIKEISSNDLAFPTFDGIIGSEFNIIVKDISGDEFILGSSTIKRIIEEGVLFATPANGDTVSSQPLLSWQEYSAEYPFTQLVEVYLFENEFSPVLKWSKAGIPQDSTSVAVTSTLVPGSYFWVIWCIDNYQNRVRSSPASFYIK